MYSLVLVSERFVAPFFVLTWTALACAVRLSDTSAVGKVLTRVHPTTVIIVLAIALASLVAVKLNRGTGVNSTNSTALEQEQVAVELGRLGMRAGDEVG